MEQTIDIHIVMYIDIGNYIIDKCYIDKEAANKRAQYLYCKYKKENPSSLVMPYYVRTVKLVLKKGV